MILRSEALISEGLPATLLTLNVNMIAKASPDSAQAIIARTHGAYLRHETGSL